MEVSGKRLENSTQFCDPCKRTNLSNQADGYCSDCNEYMCQMCFRDHLKAKICINHILDPLKGASSRRLLPTPGNKCKNHATEILKYYCKNHDSVACGDCLVSDHRLCQTEFIRDVAKNIEESPDLKILLNKVRKWEKDLTESETSIKTNRKENERLLDAVVKEIKNFRKEINAWLDKMEMMIEAEAKEMSNDNELLMSQLEQDIKSVSDEIEMIKRITDTNVYKGDDLFIHTLECKPRIDDVEKTVSEIKSKIVIQTYAFEPEMKVKVLSNSSVRLGVISGSKIHKDKFKELEVTRDSVEILTTLAEDSFGEVFAGKLRKKEDVVVKIKTKKHTTNNFLAEAKILRRLRHDKIVQLVGVCTGSEPMMIITELMANGILLHYLQKDKQLHLPQLADMAEQIAAGMTYLGKENIVHSDLRAANIQVGNRNRVKISNFSLAQIVPEGAAICADELDIPLKWTAPETASDLQISRKSDVWSYGVLLYELITFGQMPYKGVKGKEVVEIVSKGFRMQKPTDCPFPCPDEYYEIMSKCWNQKPDSRPTFAYLQDFFKNYKA